MSSELSAGDGAGWRVEVVEGPALPAEAAALRREVFVVGQGVDPAVEADHLDGAATTLHAVVRAADPGADERTAAGGAEVIATGRLVDDGTPVTRGRVGRMAVAAGSRGRGAGLAALRALEGAARARGLVGIELHAQETAAGFYVRAGYVPVGPAYTEQRMLHRTMHLDWLPGLRPVRPGEAEAVQDLIGGCFAEYPGCVLDLADLDAWMVDPTSRPLWVLPADGTAGRLDACVVVGGTELKSLYVRAQARGRGIGALLVRLAERSGALELWTDTRFADAHRLYERLGWVRQPETRDLHDPSHTTEYHYLRA